MRVLQEPVLVLTKNPILTGYIYGYKYGKFSTFSIGYGDGYLDVHICPVSILVIIFVPTISSSLLKLLKYSQLNKLIK